MLKALSHSLQVEFTYIKSGKQVRFMANDGIKTLSHSLSASLARFLSITQTALLVPGCSCVAAGWMENILLHQSRPILLSSTLNSDCLRPHWMSPSAKMQRWQIFLLTLPQLHLCQNLSPPMTSSLSNDVTPPRQSLNWHHVDSILIRRALGVCGVQTKPPSPPSYANRSNEKIEGEEGRRRRFSSVWLMLPGISIFQVFVSAHKKTRAQRALACPHDSAKRHFLPLVLWIDPQL